MAKYGSGVVILILFMVGAQAVAQGSFSGTVPAPLASSDHEKPLWVDESQAFGADGRMRTDLFRPERIGVVDNYFRPDERRIRSAAPTDSQCRSELLPPIFENDPPRARTFDAMVKRSLTIITGRVAGMQQGFYRGNPGTLLHVVVAERVKDFGRLSPSAEIRVFVNQARIQTPRGLLCAAAPLSVPMPVAGDRIAVFSELLPEDDRHEILRVDGSTGLFVERSGSLSAPARLTTTMRLVPSTLTGLVDLLRENPGVSDLIDPSQDAW